VSTSELLEVMLINVIAPFILTARVLPLMSRVERMRYIVHVSAMEGKFYRYKTPHHPHTNMAKAALNMLTRTSAEDLMKQGIFVNSVDTGWINDENPHEKSKR
jgi:NAD(P)-dependent dehydrogenase (short-subunit alcohol dehydrogenase family)